jgi:arginyl-tRNA synthetase
LTFRKAQAEAAQLVDGALEKMGMSGVAYSFSEPPHPDLGELTCNAAFSLTRMLGLPVKDAASRVVENMDFKNSRYVLSALGHVAGFINFRLNLPEIAYETVNSAIKDPDYGALKYGAGKKVIVEHTSVNPNKALHIGHARNSVVGDTLGRIYRKTGYDVQILNYIDDTGVQVADVITGMLYGELSKKAPSGMKYDQYCGDYVYVKVNDLYTLQRDLLEKRKEVSMDIEKGDNKTAKLAQEVVDKVLHAQLETLSRLDIQYDLLNFESHILRTGYWDEAFELLKKKEIVKLATEGKLKGCWVLESDEEGEEKVLVRSDGTAVYAAKDIPYAAWKMGVLPDRFGYVKFWLQAGGRQLWATSADPKKKDKKAPSFGNCDLAVAVIGVSQSRVQKFVAYALGKLGLGDKTYHHLAYGEVSLSAETAKDLGMKVKDDKESLRMSGRFGIYVNVDDVLDALRAKAREQSAEGNPSADSSWLSTVSEKLAVAALRYDMVKQDLDKTITFDLKESLKLEGDTGPYVVYSYARASRLLDRMGFSPVNFTRPLASNLRAEEEKRLFLLMSKFDMELEGAERAMAPRKVAQYAHDLAVAFNQFYEACPVSSEKEVDVKKARAYLVLGYKMAMLQVLRLLGIEPLSAI